QEWNRILIDGQILSNRMNPGLSVDENLSNRMNRKPSVDEFLSIGRNRMLSVGEILSNGRNQTLINGENLSNGIIPGLSVDENLSNAMSPAPSPARSLATSDRRAAPWTAWRSRYRLERSRGQYRTCARPGSAAAGAADVFQHLLDVAPGIHVAV